MAWRRHVLQERVAGRVQQRRKREESLRAAADAKRQEQETFEVGGAHWGSAALACQWVTSRLRLCFPTRASTAEPPCSVSSS